MKAKSQSPASTFCSDVENSIINELRRSQRLRDKYIHSQDAVDNIPKRSSPAEGRCKNRCISGSPQLFVETDEECSQLRQQQSGSHFSASGKSQLQPRAKQQNGAVKRAPSIAAVSDASAAKRRRRRSPASSKIRCHNRSTSTPAKNQINGAPARRGRLPKKLATDLNVQQIQATATVDEMSSANIAIAPKIATQSMLPALYPAHFVHQLPPLNERTNLLSGFQAELKRVAQQRAQTGGGPSIEALLAEMEQNSHAVQVAVTPATIETRQLNPDAMIAASYSETYGASPSTLSVSSASPSMSESLSELFGTKNIRNVLNIAQARNYRLQESHLPAIALMLNVELGRLRTVLRLTQRLTDAQLLQISQELEINKQADPMQLCHSLSYGDQESDDKEV